MKKIISKILLNICSKLNIFKKKFFSKKAMKAFFRETNNIGKIIVYLLKKLCKGIYNIGKVIENLFLKLIKFIKILNIKKLVNLICGVGQSVIDTSILIGKFAYNLAIKFVKSFIKDFSYWGPALATVVVLLIAISSNFYALALKVTVNDKELGYVENEQKYESTVAKVENSLSETLGENYTMDSDPKYSLSLVSKDKISEDETLYYSVYDVATSEIGENYGLFVDGSLVAANEKKEVLEDVLNKLKAPYKTNNKDEKIEFVKDVEIRAGLFSPNSFLTKEELEKKFSQSTNPIYYTIQEDDLLTNIAKKTGISRARLYELNPGLDERKLVPGKKLNISVPEIYLGIKVVKTVTYSEKISYSVKRIKSDDLYKNQTKVKKSGEYGKKEVTAEITYIDGIRQSKKIISSKTISQPVTKEIYVGTKDYPKYSGGGGVSDYAGSGSNFIRPINGGYVSCGYGGYSGHKGVDLTMHGAYGKSVYASDSGVVIAAGWSGGYGKVIKIRHSNGYETWYAHLSSINVSYGQTVSQGQFIGRIGSTGNSTGPHLHFEIRKNGSSLNPLAFI